MESADIKPPPVLDSPSHSSILAAEKMLQFCNILGYRTDSISSRPSIPKFNAFVSFFNFLFFNSFFNFLFLPFLGPLEVPRLGVSSELEPPAYARATATPDPSRVCDLHPSSRQRRILNPLSEALFKAE